MKESFFACFYAFRLTRSQARNVVVEGVVRFGENRKFRFVESSYRHKRVAHAEQLVQQHRI
jgi:hypothetical protein